MSIFIINWKLGLSFVAISALTVVFSRIPGAVMARKTVAYTQHNSSYMAVGIWFVLHGSMTVGLLVSAVQLLNGQDIRSLDSDSIYDKIG